MTTRTRPRARHISHDDRPPTTHHPRIHPDWLPPTRAAMPDLEPGAMPALAFDDQPDTTALSSPLPVGEGAAPPFPLPPIPPRPPRPVPEPLPLPPDQTPDDEDRALRTPQPSYASGRDDRLAHTALPLRHRIFALHAEGRSISAIARTLHLDRGTVARHLHAVQQQLLAEQAQDDLATLRLSAIAAQHAILAAAWDALAHEEALAADHDPTAPPAHRPRRAQLLAVTHRAARTAAQLQGLFTPAALQAALDAAVQAALPAAVQSAVQSALTTTPPTAIPTATAALAATATASPAPAHGGGGQGEGAAKPAAFCCMPASASQVAVAPTTIPALAADASSSPVRGRGGQGEGAAPTHQTPRYQNLPARLPHPSQYRRMNPSLMM